MKHKSFLMAMLLLPLLTNAAEEGVADEQSSKQIRQLFAEMTEAWRAGDGEAWASAFLPDADFTVWFGLQLHGQEAIAEGHQFIFDRFYANTSYELQVKDIRFLSPSAAVVHLNGSVVDFGEDLPEEPDSVPLAVLQKTP
jgi:uncharacterized protein (TIGR02246 family)